MRLVQNGFALSARLSGGTTMGQVAWSYLPGSVQILYVYVQRETTRDLGRARVGDFSAGEMRRFGCVLCAESSERVCICANVCVLWLLAFPYLRFSSLTVHRNFLSQLPLRILYQPVGQPTLALSRSLNHVWRRFLQTVLRGQSTEAHIVTDTHARCVGFLRAECA